MRAKTLFFFFICMSVFLFSAHAIQAEFLALSGSVTTNALDRINGSITFYIYPSMSATTSVYNQTFTNAINNSQYSVLLGNTSSPLNLTYGKVYYLDITVEGSDLDFNGQERQEFVSPIGRIEAANEQSTAANFSNAFGYNTHTIVSYSLSGGVNTTVNGTGSVGFGRNVTNTGNFSVIFGDMSISTSNYSFASGYSVYAGYNSQAFGYNTNATSSSFAAGTNANATGSHSFAFGDHSTASQNYGIAISMAHATGIGSIALGHNARSLADFGIAIGNNSYVSNPSSIAIGSYANVTGTNSIMFSIGSTNDVVSADNVLAILGGSVAINKTEPSYALDVTGTMRATGDVRGNTFIGTDASLTNATITTLNATMVNTTGITTTDINSSTATILSLNVTSIIDAIKLSPLANPPSTPQLGHLYVNSGSSELCFYNGTNWTGIANGGACE